MVYLREIATVVSNDADGEARLLRLRAPEIAGAARPFQFVLVAAPGEDLILRRPFSLFDVRDDEIELLIRPVGEGTARLGRLASGESLELSGPFGRGFDPPEAALFVAGGVGLAGVFFAVAAAARSGQKPDLVYGAAASRQMYAAARLDALGVEAVFVTEDGSRGHKGLATEYLPGLPSTPEKFLSEASEDGPPGYPRPVIACGPRPMYAALRKLLGVNSRWYVLMEERMACGVGACRGCVVPVREPEGSYAAICREGPLMPAAEIDWERLGGAK